MESQEIETGLREAADNWSDSPVRQRICATLADHRELVAEVLSPETLAAIPWPWKVSFPLNAAVHQLVLEGAAPDLEPYVPSVGGDRPPDATFDAALVSLLSEHSTRMRMLTDRPLRTQDPRQTLAIHHLLQDCADLIPADRDWSLLSLGSAAGFELLLGDTDFCSEPARYPVPRERVGVDVDPIDLTDDDALRWLLACSDASTGAVAPLVGRASARLDALEHRIVRGDAAGVLSDLPDGDAVFVVSHQFLCSVDDPAAMARAVGQTPHVTRWLSIEVPSTAERAYDVVDEHPPGTPLATLLDGDLRILQQEPLG